MASGTSCCNLSWHSITCVTSGQSPAWTRRLATVPPTKSFAPLSNSFCGQEPLIPSGYKHLRRPRALHVTDKCNMPSSPAQSADNTGSLSQWEAGDRNTTRTSSSERPWPLRAFDFHMCRRGPRETQNALGRHCARRRLSAPRAASPNASGCRCSRPPNRRANPPGRTGSPRGAASPGRRVATPRSRRPPGGKAPLAHFACKSCLSPSVTVKRHANLRRPSPSNQKLS